MQDAKKWLESVKSEMNKFVANQHQPPKSLTSYSKFLNSFQAQDFPDRELEIPGL